MINLNPFLVMGADLSLNSSGIVTIDENAEIQTQLLFIPPKGSTGVERLFFLESQLLDFLDKNTISFCAIESPAFGSEQGHLFDLGEWAGIFKLLLFKKGIIFILVAPNQLKKYASGTAQSRKETIILDVYKNFGQEIRQNDLADAYILARICRDYSFLSLNKEMDIKAYQKEVLIALQKKYKVESIL